MIPNSLLGAPESQVAEYLLALTPLGKAIAHPSIARVLAQEIAIEDSLIGYIYTPDFLIREPKLIAEWRAIRPQHAAVADQHVDALHVSWETQEGYAELPAEAWEFRKILRVAACRKIDATVTGNEVFEPHLMLAGQSNVQEVCASPRFTIKVGSVLRAYYGLDKKLAGIPELLKSQLAVEFVEEALLPILGSSDPGPAVWARRFRYWAGVASLRDFDAGSTLPMQPGIVGGSMAAMYRAGAQTPDYVERITQADLNEAGITGDELLRLGISPYVARVVDDYLTAHPDLVVVPSAGRIRQFLEDRLRRGRKVLSKPQSPKDKAA